MSRFFSGVASRHRGCGMLIGMCLLTCIFLVLNRFIVARLYTVLCRRRWTRSSCRRLLLFVGPVALIFVEWWLIDVFVERLGRLSRSASSSRSSSR